MSKKYQNEEWLRQKRIEERLEHSEIAEEANCCRGTISKWINKYDIKLPWKNKEKLENEYNEQMSIKKVGEKFGTTEMTILRWMQKFDIPRQKRNKEKHPWFGIDPSSINNRQNAYEIIRHRGNKVYFHRLLATLKVDNLKELRGKDIHHKNEIPWDNRLDNLEIMDSEEHLRHHMEKREDKLWEY